MRDTLKTYVTITGAAIVLSVAVYIGQANPKTGIPDPITVNGETITFTYTDDTTGEDLILYTDQAAYTDGLSHAQVYVAVVNNSGKEQLVELQAAFEDSKKRISDVAILTTSTLEREVPIIENLCREVVGTTTRRTETVCADETVATTSEQYSEAAWQPLSLLERSDAEVTKEAQRLSVARKVEVGYAAARKSQGFRVQSGEVVYYKVIIQYEPNISGNFYFEATGSEGGYGHLK